MIRFEVSPEFRIGITDQFDASLDLGVFKRLCPLLNIIISRDISNPQFRSLLIQHQKNVILHLVISGWGGTPVEPNTPDILKTCMYLQQLIANGFPKDHIVLRLDPIIPNDTGLEVLPKILTVLSEFGIRRLRYKLLTHPNTLLFRQQWIQACFFMKNPYFSETHGKVFYSAASWQRERVYGILSQFEWAFEFESCDTYDIHNTPHNLACISHKDLRAIGVSNVDVKFNYTNKSKCLCPVNRTSLQKKSYTQCPLRCSHCRKETLLT